MDISAAVDSVIDFWFGPGPEEPREIWFKRDAAFDAEIRTRFGAMHGRAVSGGFDAMAETARGCLALVIVLDQFSRNLYRDDARAFAVDEPALALARTAIDVGFDLELTPLRRHFLYLPFQHSESLEDQRRSVALFETLDDRSLEFAVRHFEIIERFGRFPHRNAMLGLATTEAEAVFLTEPNSSF